MMLVSRNTDNVVDAVDAGARKTFASARALLDDMMVVIAWSLLTGLFLELFKRFRLVLVGADRGPLRIEPVPCFDRRDDGADRAGASQRLARDCLGQRLGGLDLR
jgi:hypothetical protein